jgi:hypothetical protein
MYESSIFKNLKLIHVRTYLQLSHRKKQKEAHMKALCRPFILINIAMEYRFACMSGTLYNSLILSHAFSFQKKQRPSRLFKFPPVAEYIYLSSVPPTPTTILPLAVEEHSSNWRPKVVVLCKVPCVEV